jgi:hypothetical protein
MLKRSKELNVKRLTYIEVTRPAKLLLKLLEKTKLSTASLHKIKPRKRPSGPVLNISSVRNDNDEVIIFEIYHHVLDIRMKIMRQLMDSFKTFEFLKDQKPLSMIHSYMGLKIATDINSAVFMANFARWKYKTDDPQTKSKNILVIPKSQWSDALTSHLGEMLDEVVVDKRKQERLKKAVALSAYIIKAFLIRLFTKSPGEIKIDHKQGNIMVTYKLGVLKDKRNDIPFFHASEIDPKRMLIYFNDHHHVPSKEELDYMKQNGMKAVLSAGLKHPPHPMDSVPRWKPSPVLKQEKARFCRLYIKTLFQCLKEKKKHSLWILGRYWEMGMEMTHWKDFFIGNNVNVIVNSTPGVDNFVPNTALTAIGGMAVESERSIRIDYCTFIHNSPNHVYFATGPYSLTQTPEPSFSLFTVQTGGINIIENPKPIKGIEKLKRNSEIVLTVFDEAPNDMFFGDTIQQMYRFMIDLVDNDPRFSMLIKTKKPQVLKKMADINKEILRLCEQGKCLLADWKVSPSTAIKNGDLTATMISTTAFESILLGAKTVIFYPMRAGCKIFYSNNGLNKRIFEDKQSMVAAIKKFAGGSDDSIGDCSDIKPEIDPFGDGNGAKRMGDYLAWCQQGFDTGLEWKEILGKANERYTQQWGTGRITSENAYESLYKKN